MYPIGSGPMASETSPVASTFRVHETIFHVPSSAEASGMVDLLCTHRDGSNADDTIARGVKGHPRARENDQRRSQNLPLWDAVVLRLSWISTHSKVLRRTHRQIG